MDSIVEYLIKKDKDALYSFKKGAVIISIFALCLLSYAFIKNFGVLIAVLLIYLLIKFIDIFDVEYEYCIVNSDMDIDKIYGRARRTRYVSIDGNAIDIIAPVGSDELKEYKTGKEKVYYAVKNKKNPDNYAIIGYNKKGRVMIMIDNDKKVLEQFKAHLPRKVIIKKVSDGANK